MFLLASMASQMVIDLDGGDSGSANQSLLAKHMQPAVQASLTNLGASPAQQAQSGILGIACQLNRSDSERTLMLGEDPKPSRPVMSLPFKPSAALEKYIPQVLPVAWLFKC